MMTTSERIRIEATDEHKENRGITSLRFAEEELEQRVMPLVVIAIIAILIGLLLLPV